MGYNEKYALMTNRYHIKSIIYNDSRYKNYTIAKCTTSEDEMYENAITLLKRLKSKKEELKKCL